MKTLKFFGLLIITFFFVNTSNAQWPPAFDGTKTVIMNVSGFFALNVTCEGETIDEIFPGNAKIQIHYKDGVPVWEKIKGINNTFTSSVTGEKFKIKTVEGMSYSDNINELHFNAIGNMGSHYIGRLKALWLGPGLGFELIEAEVKCK